MNGFGFGSNSEMTYASDVLQTGLPRFRVIFLSGMSKAKLKKKQNRRICGLFFCDMPSGSTNMTEHIL